MRESGLYRVGKVCDGKGHVLDGLFDLPAAGGLAREMCGDTRRERTDYVESWCRLWS
jgi:hypothetical protein